MEMNLNAAGGNARGTAENVSESAGRRGLKELLFLKNLPGVGKRTINRYCMEALRMYLSEDDIDRKDLGRQAVQWLRPAGVQPAGRDIEAAESVVRRVLEWLDAHQDVRAVTALDCDYPKRLRDLGQDQPPVLYIRRSAFRPISVQENDPEREKRLHIAVIGSRWPDDRTFREGPALAEALVRECGAVIISGLARGCDAIGHRAAIRAGGVTGAVLASGIDIITPAMHTDLAGEILRTGGFLMSEYDPGTEAENFRYVERDRLTAALSDGILVLECGVQSGTMQTVRAGSELGRPLACVFPADGTEAAEGNRHMRDHYKAEVIITLEDLFQWSASVRNLSESFNGAKGAAGSAAGKENESGAGHILTEQLTFFS